MKTIFSAKAGLAIILLLLASCSSNNKDNSEKQTNTSKDLNITVFIDLSDRVTRTLTPNQVSRDTMIINYLADYFVKKTDTPKNIRKSKNKIKILAYPTPDISNIPYLCSNLNVDFENYHNIPKKIELLDSMKLTFQKNLTPIFDETLKNKKFIGCDIWNFFNSGNVDKQCIRPGFRNILIILTDGYLYHEKHLQQKGTAFSYVSPKTLGIPNSSLIADRNGLQDLEVLILEINPISPAQKAPMINVLKEWLQKMEVGKYDIAETDALMTTTFTVIENFLKE